MENLFLSFGGGSCGAHRQDFTVSARILLPGIEVMVLQRKTVKVDMTKGRIFPLVLRFALPLCIGSILQQL